MTTLSVKTNPCTQGPGKYGAYNFPNSLCTLHAGALRDRGRQRDGVDQTGNASSILRGTGVTLYFTCGTPTTPVTCVRARAGRRQPWTRPATARSRSVAADAAARSRA